MIEILGVTLTYEALGLILLFTADEILPFLPVKANSFTHALSIAADHFRPGRKEAEQIAELRKEIQGLLEIVNSAQEEEAEPTYPERGR